MTRIFFYGTLMPSYGGARAHVLDELGAVSGGPATLSGYDMLAVGDSFPAILPGTGTVKGEVVGVSAGRTAEALRVCDSIEGYDGPGKPHNLYNRVELRLDDGTWAFVYVWNKDRRQMPVVESGDWLDFKAESWLRKHADSFKMHLAAIQREAEDGPEEEDSDPYERGGACPECGSGLFPMAYEGGQWCDNCQDRVVS